jgi:hypothetical protein
MSRLNSSVTLIERKSEGFIAEASKGEAVVGCCESLATKDMKSSGFPAIRVKL